MRSILLIRPKCASEEPEFAEPLGIERLAGYLRANGAEDVRVLDRRLYEAERDAGFLDDSAAGSFDELRASYPMPYAPDIVGLSLMTSADVVDARRIISRLRAWWPNARFVAGGVFVTTAYEQAKRMLPGHVALVRGEGEAFWLKLAKGADTPNDDCIDDGWGPVLDSPDNWAFAARPYMARYARLGCAVNIQASRGCQGACAFCATPQLPHELRLWRPRSASLVVEEIAQRSAELKAAGALAIFNFVDDDIGPLARLEELASELKRRKLRIAFSCEMRLASLSGQPNLAKRLEKLHDAGLMRVFFGIESLNRATLTTWRKPSAPLDGLQGVLESCRLARISVQAGYIMWHKDQTVSGARSEAEQLHKLGIYTHKAALSRLVVFPGCELAKTGANERGFQQLGSCEEAFHQRFVHASEQITRTWTKAAIAEPYAACAANLTGDSSRFDALQRQLAEANALSYELFMSL